VNVFKEKLFQRKTVCFVLGILSGLVCCWMIDKGSDMPVWGTPLMWAMLWNRMLIGMVVFVTGVFNYNAMFGFRFYPWFRGAVIGAFVSGGPAISSLMGPQGYIPEAVWGTIIAGAVYGLIIDVVATKLAGDGKAITGDWVR